MRSRRAIPLNPRWALSGPPLVVVAYFASAVVFLSWQEGWSHVDSFYFSVKLLTTVGYGDVSPVTRGGKLATCFFALAGVTLVMHTVEQLLSRAAGNSLIRDAKRRLFGDIHAGDLLEPSALLARRRAHIRVLRRICAGMLLLGCLEGRIILGLDDWVNCLYYSVITVTTIGLGDFTPSTPFARLFTATLSLMTVPIFASMLSSYIDLQSALSVVRPHQLHSVATGLHGREFVRVKDGLSAERLAALAHFNTEVCTTSALTTSVTREDFLVFVLVQNGIMSKEDIRTVWDDFARLDQDGDGKIDVNDLEERMSQRQSLGTSDAQPIH